MIEIKILLGINSTRLYFIHLDTFRMNYRGENKVLTSLIIVETTLDPPGVGGYSLVRPIWGCAAGQGMFKSLRALTSLVKGR